MAAARSYLQDSLEICRQIGRPKTCGLVLRTLGHVLVHQGDYGGARSLGEQALRILRDIGYRWGEGEVLWTLALLSRHQGDYGQAKRLFGHALQIARETHNAERESRTLADLGLLHLRLGDEEKAEEYARLALDAAKGCGGHWYEAWASTVLGHVLADIEQFTAAIEAYERALDLYEDIHLPQWNADARTGLVCVALNQGDLGRAIEHAEDLVAYLQAWPRVECSVEPFRIYLTCYNVLRAVDDPRADRVLNAAHRLLQERAGTIPDKALRRLYVESAPYHREIAAAWEERGLGSRCS
jgi:tetratricopeptide (TPR) repeat protein